MENVDSASVSVALEVCSLSCSLFLTKLCGGVVYMTESLFLLFRENTLTKQEEMKIPVLCMALQSPL
jgi:hypothetical protein